MRVDDDTDPKQQASPQNNEKKTAVLAHTDDSQRALVDPYQPPPPTNPTNMQEAPTYPYQSSSGWGAPANPYQTQPGGWGAPTYPYQSPSSWGVPANPYQPPPTPIDPQVSVDRRDSTGILALNAINADPSNPREVGITQLRLISRYHNNVLQQAEQSFRWALIGAGIGLAFFLASISFLVLKQPANISYTSLISGSLVEVISAINFSLYGKASTQLASFHLYLDRTHRFLLADSVCENLKNDNIRDETRSDLVRKIMDAKSSTGLLGNSRSKSSKISEE